MINKFSFLSYLKVIKHLYIRIAAACLVLGIGLFFVFTKHYFDTEYNKSIPVNDVSVLQISGRDSLEQTVFFQDGRINSIGICAINRTNSAAGGIEITLTADNGEVVWSVVTEVDKLPLRKTDWFKVDAEVKSNQEYVLGISALNITGSVQFAGAFAGDNARGVENAVCINSVSQDSALLMQMTYYRRLGTMTRIIIFVWTIVLVCYILMYEILFRNKATGTITALSTLMTAILCIYAKSGIEFKESQNYKIFFVLVCVIVSVLALCVFLILKGSKRVELYFVITTLLFGIVYSLILPPFSAPDEDRHFLAAYRLSNVLMGQSINDENGKTYMRECDITEYEPYVSNESMIGMTRSLIRGERAGSTEMMPSKIIYAPRTWSVLYLPQALGISVGKLFHVNYIRLVYCGRIMNLLTFILITAFAIKLLPYGKWIVYAICQIPVVMELVSSYSYDVLVISMTFLLIAYIIKLSVQKENISWKQWIILAVISMVYAPLKPVYLPFVALVFLLPFMKKGMAVWKDFACVSIVFLVSLGMVLAVHKGSFLMLNNFKNETKPKNKAEVSQDSMVLDEEKEITITYQDHFVRPNAEFILENPFDLVESYAGALVNLSDEYLLSAFGRYLGWYDIYLPVFIPIICMFLLYMAYAAEDYQPAYGMSLYKKGWVLLMLFGCWFAVLLTFYLLMTNPSQKTLGGVQGRYFIPSFVLIIFLLRGKHYRNENHICGITMTSILIQTLAIVNICRAVWSR